MTVKKYELIPDDTVRSWDGRTLFRIRALVAIAAFGVAVGEVGGYVESEAHLSQSGNAWVYGDARVFGNAEVCGDAEAFGNADLLWISKIGSRNGTVTFFKAKAGIQVSCGCFRGTLAEFEGKVQATHGDNEHGRAYKLAIELAKLRLGE